MKPRGIFDWPLTVAMLCVLLMLATGACAVLSGDGEPTDLPDFQTQSTPTSNRSINTGGRLPAAELRGTGQWINSEPFTLESQRGNVALIDFWTYSCINCIRTLPHLKEWDEKYRDEGLVILGVHTPEFVFEQDYANLARAVADEGITWAVVQDNDREVWDAYNNLYWPSKYLIDRHGVMRYFYGGEGGYDLTEGRIRTLLEEAGADLSDVPFASVLDDTPSLESEPSFDESIESGGARPADNSGLEEMLDPTFRGIQNGTVTSELLLGYEGGCRKNLFSNSKIADPRFCSEKGVEIEYLDSGERQDHRLYIQGTWTSDSESLRHTRQGGDSEAYLRLRFASKSVNIVASSDQPQTKMLVTLDGGPLTDSNRGEDVVIEEDGRSYLLLDKPRLYGVVELPAYGFHEVKLNPNSDGFAAYSITFGVYAIGP